MNKYRNIKTSLDGVSFDSKAEARRWQELKLLERQGEISRLERQIPFKLTVNGIQICKYIADFQYREGPQNELVVEDTKSPATAKARDFVLKRKLMRAIYNIDLRVTA